MTCQLDATDSVRTVPGIPLSQDSWFEFLSYASVHKTAGDPAEEWRNGIATSSEKLTGSTNQVWAKIPSGEPRCRYSSYSNQLQGVLPSVVQTDERQ